MFGDLRIMGSDGLLTARANEVVKWPQVATDEAFRWLRDGEPMQIGGTGKQYRPTVADQGHTIGLRYSFKIDRVSYSVEAVDPVFIPDPAHERAKLILTAMYEDILGRAPDAEGLAWWLGVRAGGMGWAELVPAFLAGVSEADTVR